MKPATIISAVVIIAATNLAWAGEQGGKPKLDTDGDGVVSQQEFDASRMSNRTDFASVDTNSDGVLTKDELRSAHKKGCGGKGRHQKDNGDADA